MRKFASKKRRVSWSKQYGVCRVSQLFETSRSHTSQWRRIPASWQLDFNHVESEDEVSYDGVRQPVAKGRGVPRGNNFDDELTHAMGLRDSP